MAQRALPAVLRAALCCVLLPAPAASAQTDEPAGVYGLGEVIVVTGKSKGVQATQAVSTVTAEDIRSSGARTLDQAISLLPGVNVRVGGEGIVYLGVSNLLDRNYETSYGFPQAGRFVYGGIELRI
jgi:vitamin B12 transporter